MDMTSPQAEGTPDGYGPFAHLTAPNVLLYRAVMRAFLVAKERFAVHLRPEDVYAGLASGVRPTELDAVVKALDSLVGGGTCALTRTPGGLPPSRISTASGSSTSSRGRARRRRRLCPRTTRRSGGGARCRPSRCTTS
ncbi:hypothetical protein SAVIM40S_05451 [Streptomyces avidinii]